MVLLRLVTKALVVVELVSVVFVLNKLVLVADTKVDVVAVRLLTSRVPVNSAEPLKMLFPLKTESFTLALERYRLVEVPYLNVEYSTVASRKYEMVETPSKLAG